MEEANTDVDKDAPTHVVSVPLRLTPQQRAMQTGAFIRDTLDLDLARKAWSAGPDVDWLAKSSADTTKHRVRRHQRPSLRSLERIKARHKRRSSSDRDVRQEPLYPSPTAQVSA